MGIDFSNKPARQSSIAALQKLYTELLQKPRKRHALHVKVCTGAPLRVRLFRVGLGAFVTHLLGDLDVVWTLAALVPLAIAAAAWALRMACGFCSVEPPEFWHAVTIIVVVAVTNVVLRFVLEMTDNASGIGPEYAAPALATTAVLAVSLPTGPFSALTIMVVQTFLCAMIYYCLGWVQAIITVPLVV